ncbi:MAG: antibiotic biosynthesis monooxygenase [Dehalococcoidia bacterium]|nr:antibiotic biosynthesis monooxygenase [Dehalococcoidia bacterium]
MAYVRISLMRPLSGRDQEALKLNSELVELYRDQQGCLGSHLITAADGSGEMGRVSFWASEAAADTAATTDRSLFLRSRLHLLVRRGHQDRSFQSQ